MECKLNDITINYEEYGEGIPIIMLHGYYSDLRLMKGCMEPIFAKIQGFRRIYFDLPGMGKTNGEHWIRSSDDMLNVVLEFIEKIIPNEEFLIASESYGGYLARGVIYKKAELVKGVMFICPVIIPDFSLRNLPKRVVLLKDDELMSRINERDAKRFRQMAVLETKDSLDKYLNDILPGIEICDMLFLTNIRSKHYAFSFDVDKNKFHKPALFLLGKQDASVGYKDAMNILDNYTRCTFCIVDRAGHNLQIEQVEIFKTLTSEWLNSIYCENC